METANGYSYYSGSDERFPDPRAYCPTDAGVLPHAEYEMWKAKARVAEFAHLHYKNVTTRKGNALCMFFNEETNLLVVDLCNDIGGNEIVRMTLAEDRLLDHL